MAREGQGKSGSYRTIVARPLKLMITNKGNDLSPLEAIHQTVSGLYDAGIIDGETMRT